MGIEKMLRMYLLQCWFNLSDEGVEEAIYDSYAFRKFMGINFAEEQVPDATTLLHFRHIIEENKIGEKLFNALKAAFDEAGLIYRGGTYCRCQSHCSTQLHKERKEGTRSRNAPGQKRKPVVFRYENPYWCRCRNRLRSQR